MSSFSIQKLILLYIPNIPNKFSKKFKGDSSIEETRFSVS